MKTATLALAVAALAATTTVSANPRHHHSRYYSYPYFSWYVSPYIVAPYYAYPPPPVWVERPPVVIERRYVEEAPPPPPSRGPSEPHYRQGERSNAQITPPAPPPPSESRATITPPPDRLERYTLSATELFEFDKATLRMPQPKLDEIARVLAGNPGIADVTITGYTDRLGSEAYNLRLSQRRADAVKAYLIGKGVEARRLKAIGKGEANPVVHCNDKDRAALIRCLAPNRRVEVESITVEVRRK